MKRKILISALLCFAFLICFVGCGEKTELETGHIGVELKGDDLKITVKPDAELLETYSDSHLILFMNAPGESFGDGTNATEVGRKRAKETVTFNVPFTESGKSRLYCSFTAAFFDSATNRYVEAVKGASYVSNPESAADNQSELADVDSIKGINAVYDSEAVSLGVSHAVIELPIEKYLLEDGNSRAYSYIFYGKSYYLDRDAVDELDSRVKYYTENGVRVYLRFTLGHAESELPEKLSCLACPGTNEGETRYVINMANPECARYVSGFADFVAERYTREDGKYGTVSCFIASSSANTPGKSAGSLTKETYFASNARLVRTLYLAMSSHYANGRVYVSVDNNLRYSSSGSCDSNVHDFLTWFASDAKEATDYPWGVCTYIKATSADPERVWYDNSGDGGYITPSNLGALTDSLMSTSELMYCGEARDLIGEFSIGVSDSESAQTNQAASYAYTYYQAVATGKLGALIYASVCDSESVHDGLHPIDADGNPQGARKICEMLLNIDTDADINSAVGSAITDSAWQTLYSHYRESVVKKTKHTGGASAVDPQSYDTSVLFDFSSGTTQDFFVKGRESFVGLVPFEGASSLSAHLAKPTLADKPYVAVAGLKKNMLRGNSLLLTLCAEGAEAQVGNYTVRLCMVQNNKKGEDVVYISDFAVVSGNGTVTLAFDTKSVTKAFGNGEIELRIYAEGELGSSCVLRIDEIMTGKKKTNTVLLVILVVLAVSALIAAIALLAIWFSKNYKVSFISRETKEEREERLKLKAEKKALEKENKVKEKAKKAEEKEKKSKEKKEKIKNSAKTKKKTQKKA